MNHEWNYINNPIRRTDRLPSPYRIVLVFIKDKALPFCAYLKYAAGDIDSPYFVVYHGNIDMGTEVVAWCDCLPDNGPEFSTFYNKCMKK